MTLEFTTPRKHRDRKPIAVDLCGQELTIEHPKKSTLYFAQVVTAESASQPERAAAMWQFVEGTLSNADRSIVMRRAQDPDDPLNFEAVHLLIDGLMSRWETYDTDDGSVLSIGEQDSTLDLEPVTVTLDGEELHCRAPKDLMLWIVMSALSDESNIGQQAWGVGQFLDACLAPAERIKISDRLRDQDDDLDLEELSDLANALTDRWAPAESSRNRADRRAAQRTSNNGSSGGGKKAGTGTGSNRQKASSARRAPARR